jgi:hypothetical protein
MSSWNHTLTTSAAFCVFKFKPDMSIDIIADLSFDKYCSYVEKKLESDPDPECMYKSFPLIGDARILNIPKIQSQHLYKCFITADCVFGARTQCVGKLVLCPPISSKTDKYQIIFYNYDNKIMDDERNINNNVICTWYAGRNWSMWLKDDKLYYSYQFLPHIVINNIVSTECEKITTSQITNPFFAFAPNNYRFSLGTPAIQYNETEYIAIGHSRFNHNLFENAKADDVSSPMIFDTKTKTGKIQTNFNNFIQSIDEPKYTFHGVYVYFMYIYTFDINKPFENKRMSHSFIPLPCEWLLVFPVGICPLGKFDLEHISDQDRFIISYGSDGDSKAKLLILSRKKIESLLKPIETMVSNPETHEFSLMEQ